MLFNGFSRFGRGSQLGRPCCLLSAFGGIGRVAGRVFSRFDARFRFDGLRDKSGGTVHGSRLAHAEGSPAAETSGSVA